MIESNTNQPTFVFDDLPLHWQMTRSEKFAFAALVEKAQAEIAIEIGTYKGGSLQTIAKHARKVYSVDILSDCKEELGPRFKNVEFLTGKSHKILPSLFKRIEEQKEALGFVLIDGEHSAKAVRGDINAVLKHKPIRPVYIVFHDSFNPPCRKGILSADWQSCEYVHYVEVDFVPGVFHFNGFDTAQPRSMFAGLAVALMLPEKRIGELVIHQSQQGLFDTIYAHSCHTTLRESRFLRFMSRVKHKLFG